MPPGRSDVAENFPAGVDDVLIVPLAVLAFGVEQAVNSTLSLLLRLMDLLFPILLQLMRFPLFTLRIIGDGTVALSKALVAVLPVGGQRRAAWRESISMYWAWLRQKISYHAFERWIHHAFENGMAWVFKTCRTLTPRSALLVIFGAVLWLPISFGAATLLHGALLAKAAVLPAWMQLLHPFATIIAKSKLLVLPVYPAAWPQARKHPFVQASLRFWHYVSAAYLARKMHARYWQIHGTTATGTAVIREYAEAIGLNHMSDVLLRMLNRSGAAIGNGWRSAVLWLVNFLAAVPLLERIVRRYRQHYEEVNQGREPLLSQRVRDFYDRWSVKFTAQYYEARERDQFMKVHDA